METTGVSHFRERSLGLCLKDRRTQRTLHDYRMIQPRMEGFRRRVLQKASPRMLLDLIV